MADPVSRQTANTAMARQLQQTIWALWVTGLAVIGLAVATTSSALAAGGAIGGLAVMVLGIRLRQQLRALHDVNEHEVSQVRREADSKMQQTRQEHLELRTAIDEHAVIAIIDNRGCISQVNANFCRISGHREDEVIGQSFRIISGRVFERLAWRKIRRQLSDGKVWRGEVENLTSHGQPYWIDTTIVPFADAEGQSYQFVAIGTDITQRKKAQLETREKEALFRTLAEIAPAGIFRMDPDQTLTYVNQQFEQISGCDPTTVLGNPWTELVHPKDQTLVEFAWNRAVSSNQLFAFEFRFQHADETEVWVTCHSRAETDDSGNVLGYVGTVSDISERRHAAEELRASVREKDTLLREIHHRVKNNLQIISSLLYFQAKKLPDPATSEVFQELRHRLSSMILVHEKLYQSEHLDHIDFVEYCRELIDTLRLQMTAQGEQLVVTLNATALHLPIEIALPGGMMLVELLTNVQKYAFPHGTAGSAEVDIATDGDIVCIIVSDPGIGLPPDFDMTTSSSFGWQLIRSLVDQLGGQVTVDSQRGTRVTIVFPYSSANTPEIPAHHPSYAAINSATAAIAKPVTR